MAVEALIAAVDVALVTGHTEVLATIGLEATDARMGRWASAGGGVDGGGSGIVSRATVVTVANGGT